MGNEASVESVLLQIAGLLRQHGQADWADAFERLAGEYREAPELTKGRIRSVYGGMGSFNDLVLHGDDKAPLRSENDALGNLRTQLYVLCCM